MSAKKFNISAVFICLAMIVSLAFIIVPDRSYAESGSEVTLVCQNGSTRVPGIYWRIYKVGDRVNGEFVLNDEFKIYPIDISGLTEENIGTIAHTFESYVIADRKVPYDTGYTDENGDVTFAELEDGLYLAFAKGVKMNQYYYEPSAMFFEVSPSNPEDYKAYPKIYGYATLADEVRNYVVKKVWDDSNDAYLKRPAEIIVDLYKDWEYEDTVVLNSSNNWEEKWTSFDPYAEWRVVERIIPAKYKVNIEFNETQYLIKNTYSASFVFDYEEYEHIVTTAAAGTDIRTSGTNNVNTTVTTTLPSDSENHTNTSSENTAATVTGDTALITTYTSVSSGTDTSDTSNDSDTTSDTVSSTTTTTTAVPPSGGGSSGGGSSGGKLPQTGQLWWPVIPLTLGGILLIAIGFIIKPQKENYEQ